jgi:excisionase family DNA binding protein
LTNTTQETLSVLEAGKLLGVSRNTAYRLIHEGTIPALRLGRKWRVPKSALAALLLNPPTIEEVK